MSKQSLIKKADALFAEWFHAEHRICVIEGCTDRPELHHIIGKGNKLYRWLRINALPLCQYHHTVSRLLSAHGSPEAFNEWLRIHRPDQYEFMMKNKYIHGVSLKDEWYRDQLERVKEMV